MSETSENPPRAATSIDEIAEDLYRIHTPVPQVPGGFSFNQFLLRDERPLLFHTGPRALFKAVCEAIERVLPVERIGYIGFSHVEGDECGSLNEFLAAAPKAVPLCGRVAAMTSVRDIADRAPKVLADGERLELGRHSIRWLDAPHVPHGWENGFIAIEDMGALLCGDLFTQPGAAHPPVVESDILGPSEALRSRMDYYAHGPATGPTLERLAALEPRLLACMHGSAWRGDGAALLRKLARTLASEEQ